MIQQFLAYLWLYSLVGCGLCGIVAASAGMLAAFLHWLAPGL